MGHEFDLLKSPFSYDVETVADELQMKLIDLLADYALKSSFEKKPLIEFYESQRNSKMSKNSQGVVCINTYMRANFHKYDD